MRTGLSAGRRIGHEVRGQSFDKPFKYHDVGSAAHVSRGNAVVSAFRLNFGVFVGLRVWLIITGYCNRVGVVVGCFDSRRPPGTDLHHWRHPTGDRVPWRQGRPCRFRCRDARRPHSCWHQQCPGLGGHN
jgi:hypothetical protein